jgi:hydroxymethylpyrimidine kinase/phosphomethylpyrimidine kinase
MREMGARAVLVKGGHLAGDALDLLDEEGRVTVFRGERIETTSTHGTGCTLAAAIAACMARGMNLEDAVGTAKRYVADAIRHAPGIGHGHGPIGKTVTSDK